ncbi:hypothetical protein [Pseudoduganella armeniaca]|uniref:hypothetical protein n=1 Tax=Pseudoduganella armeniaca TaxID=2072590 RepID=UPI0011B258A6|nr:hypothetical protein [Pseudoduganella armeniaca]
MEIEKRPWFVAAALTIVMSVSTGIGTFVSSYVMLPMKMKEKAEKAVVERKAKGMQVRCEKLQMSASLAAEIQFAADRGYPSVSLAKALAAKAANKPLSQKISDKRLLDDQLALEKRATELIPFLSESEAETLQSVVLHHFVLTQMRTSKAPENERVPPSAGGFDGNDELNRIRSGASEIARAYRARCTENT